MRTYFIAFIALALTFSGCDAKETKTGYQAFYNYFKDYDNIITFRVPGGFAKFIVDKQEDEAKEFLSKMDNISFLIVENDAETIKGELKTFLPKNVYKDLMVIKDGSAIVTFLVHDKDEIISEIIMVVDDEDELVVMGIHGKFTHDDAKLIAKSINKDQAIKFRN